MQIYKAVAIKGYMVEFYHNEDDKKLSFRIQDNEKLTQVLLAHCSEKRVKVGSIKYAISGIREKIERGILDPASVQTRGPQVTSEDYCTKINLHTQKEHGEGIYFETYPMGYETKVVLTMPDGKEFQAVASNKKLAKQLAAKQACDHFAL